MGTQDRLLVSLAPADSGLSLGLEIFSRTNLIATRFAGEKVLMSDVTWRIARA
jgi:hypothetical protein